MNLRLIVDEALEESGFGSVSAMDAHEMSEKGAGALNSASSALNQANSGLAGELSSSISEHDKKYHPGGYKGGACKLRDKVGSVAANAGISPESIGLSGQSSSEHDDGVSPELDSMRKAKEELERAEKLKNKHPHDYKAAVEKFNATREAYIKSALGADELEAVNKLCEKAGDPESSNRVKAFLNNIGGKIMAAVKGGTKDIVSPAQATAIEKISEAAGEPVPEEVKDIANDDPTPASDTPQASEAQASATNEESTPEATETPEPVQLPPSGVVPSESPAQESPAKEDKDSETAPEISVPEDPSPTPESPFTGATGSGPESPEPGRLGTPGAGGEAQEKPTRKSLRQNVWDARERLAMLRENGGSDMEIAQAQAELNDAKKKLEEYNPSAGLYEEVKKRQDELSDLEQRKEAGEDITEEDIAKAEKKLEQAEKKYDEYGTGGKEQAPGGQAEGASKDGNAPKEYHSDGKTYVDVSELGFLDSIRKSFMAGFEGKEIITSFDKATGRFNQIVANDKKHQKSLDELKDAMNAVRIGNLFDKFIDGTDDDYLKERIKQFKEDYSRANGTAERNRVLNSYNKFLHEEGLRETPRQKAAREAKEAEENKGSTVGEYNPDKPSAAGLSSKFSGNKPGTDIYAPLPASQTDTTFGTNLGRAVQDALTSKFGKNADGTPKVQISNTTHGSSVTEYTIKRAPGISNEDVDRELAKVIEQKGGAYSYTRDNNWNENTGYMRVSNPNKKDAALKRLLEHPNTQKAEKMASPFLVGEEADGTPIWSDIGEHGFIGGDSGSGKSYRVRGGIAGAMHVKSPNEVQYLVNAHANKADYDFMDGDPHTMGIAGDVQSVSDNLDTAMNEWRRRKKLFADENVPNLEAYNKKMTESGRPQDRLPQIQVITDEVTNLLSTRGDLEDKIKDIVTNGRKFGVSHLGITQDMSADNMDAGIKGRVRMGVMAKNPQDSRKIFGEHVPELSTIAPKGDIMVTTPDGIKRLRGTYASDDDVSRLRDYNIRTYKRGETGGTAGNPTGSGDGLPGNTPHGKPVNSPSSNPSSSASSQDSPAPAPAPAQKHTPAQTPSPTPSPTPTDGGKSDTQPSASPAPTTGSTEFKPRMSIAEAMESAARRMGIKSFSDEQKQKIFTPNRIEKHKRDVPRVIKKDGEYHFAFNTPGKKNDLTFYKMPMTKDDVMVALYYGVPVDGMIRPLTLRNLVIHNGAQRE